MGASPSCDKISFSEQLQALTRALSETTTFPVVLLDVISGYLIHNEPQILLIAGKSGKKIETFNPSCYGLFLPPSSIQKALRERLRATLNNGFIIEGPSSQEVYLVHFIRNVFLRVNLLTDVIIDMPLPLPVAMAVAPTPVSVNGQCFLLGGAGMFLEPLQVVQSFNPFSCSWSFKSPMNIHRTSLAVASWKNRLYVVGGSNHGQRLNSAEYYDLSSDTWTNLPNMSCGRSCATALGFANKLFVFGGDSTGNTAECFDLTTRKWVAIAQMPVPRRNAHVVECQGKIYLCGGLGVAHGSMDCYDPALNSWLKVELPSRPIDAAISIKCSLLSVQ